MSYKKHENEQLTISKTQACSLLECLIPKLNRLIKSGDIESLMIQGEKYERITTFSLTSHLHNRVVDLDKESTRLKKALQAIANTVVQATMSDYKDGQAVLDKYASIPNPEIDNETEQLPQSIITTFSGVKNTISMT